MQNRPIRNEEWDQYEIVLKVDDDAEKIVVGMFIIGSGKAWLDNATLEEVDPDTPTTELIIGAPAGSGDDKKTGSNQTTRFRIPPAVRKAMGEAEHAPQQPFFNHWLWLALIALVLFALSRLPPKEIQIQTDAPVETKKVLGPVTKFALRFSVVYWLLYSLPAPFSSLIPYLGAKLRAWHQAVINKVVAWVAENIFRISGELVPPNGSGDTTFNYVNVFVVFVLALAIASFWSLIDRRKTDYRNLKDLLRSYLRYVLALTLLGYGLSKVAWDMNQFPTISAGQLNKTWGDSSPMNVLWSFMGASRAYTVFAGLGEVVAGLLLIFRRTTTIGAFVALGVMTNVMMLNYCYDVPVKLYSTHLVCMALYLLLPEVGRLTNVLFLNRPTKPIELKPPFTGPKTIWIHRTVKLAFIVMGFGIPIYRHIDGQIDYFAQQSKLPEYFGAFDVVEYKLNGRIVPPSQSGRLTWKTVKFQRLRYNMRAQPEPADWISIGLAGGGNAAASYSTVDGRTLDFDEHQNTLIPNGRAELARLNDDKFKLVGRTVAGTIDVTLQRRSVQANRPRLSLDQRSAVQSIGSNRAKTYGSAFCPMLTSPSRR